MDTSFSNIKLKYESLSFFKIVYVNKIDKIKAIKPPSRMKCEKNDADSNDPNNFTLSIW